MVEKLTLLRQQIESDTGQSIHHLNLNAAALLDDFCHAIGLDDAQICAVIGNGYDKIYVIEDESDISPAPIIYPNWKIYCESEVSK